MAPLIPDSMLLRGGPSVPMPEPTRNVAQSPPGMGPMGGICNEDIRVPDKMVGLSKCKSAGDFVFFSRPPLVDLENMIVVRHSWLKISLICNNRTFELSIPIIIFVP